MKIDRMKQEWMLNLVTIIDKNKQVTRTLKLLEADSGVLSVKVDIQLFQ